MPKNLLTYNGLCYTIKLYSINGKELMRVEIINKSINGEVPVKKKSYWQRRVEEQLAQINNEIKNINKALRGALQSE